MYSLICKYSYVCFIVLKLLYVSLKIASLGIHNMDPLKLILVLIFLEMYSVICKNSYVCFIVIKLLYVSLKIVSLGIHNIDLFKIIIVLIFFQYGLSSECYKHYYFIEGLLANQKLLNVCTR